MGIKMLWNKGCNAVRANSPKLFLIAGIVTTVSAVVMAVKATPKAEAAIEECRNRIANVEKAAANGVNDAGEKYTEEDKQKDVRTIKIQTGIKVIRVFTPTALLLGGSIASQICGYREMSARFAAAGAAYAALSDRYNRALKRTEDKYGKEEAAALFTGKSTTEVLDVTDEVDENGQPILKKRTITVADDDDYTIIFGPFFPDGTPNPDWSDSMEINIQHLQMEQSYLTKMLQGGCDVTLNFVRSRFNYPRTEAGQIVGWHHSTDPNYKGDGYVSFGLEDLYTRYRHGEEIPNEGCIVLNFNVDGNILPFLSKNRKALTA